MAATDTQPTMHPVRKRVRDHGAMAFMPPNTPAPSPEAIAAQLTKRERQIMLAMLVQVANTGDATPINRAALRTSAAKMQEMYYAGWAMGAGTRDDRGTGNTPDSSWWWLTTHGEQIARAIGQQEAL